jgi:4-diphosphocytidyl-2-C-methyl-D-erythritol kinase
MVIQSPAKINLHLRVAPPAADGFHPIMSWFCTVGLSDRMEIAASDQPGISLSCDRADVPADSTNLIVRAGSAMLKQMPSPRGAVVRLEKKIPMGGGLGGGSSNAAGAMLGFNRIWNLNWPTEKLSQIGAGLGSDIPFFLFGGPSAICTGRGEHVRPIDRPKPKWVVLIFPKFSMATPQVYRRFDELHLGSTEAIEQQPDWRNWTKTPADQLLPKLVNDLEKPAFDLSPELAKLRTNLEQSLGRIIRMSGSGSTLFTLADDVAQANKIAADIRAKSIDAIAAELGISI